MPTVVFDLPDGRSISVEAPTGMNLMRASTLHGIAGIVGECGGALSCASCHVIVDEADRPRLPAISDNEDQMLDCTAAPRGPNSRLGCQIVMTPELDGLRVRVADPQV